MKKTLGAQVKAYLEHKGDGYTPAKLAAEVAQLQRDLPEGKRCKRQNIEQLLESDFRTVRYLPVLAAAMGTTVETLHAGRYEPGAVPAVATVAPALAPAPSPGEPTVMVPVLANAGSMGGGIDALHEDVMVGALTLSENWVTKYVRPTRRDALRFIHGFGDSMSPTFEDGDVLLVDTGVRDPQAIDGVYVLAANNRIYIKRVRCRMDGAMEVSSDNSTVKTVDVLNGDSALDVLGRVVWCWNGKKL